MIERQYRQHPPLPPAPGGSPARMFEQRGNGRVVYYVECYPENLRTDAVASPSAAARAWARGQVHAITPRAVVA